MAAENFEACLAMTLKWEGSYSNHPDDPGGPTMRGITQAEYDRFRKSKGKRYQPVRLITDAELTEIYRVSYWDSMDCDSYAAGLDLAVFDAAVNSGTKRAHLWLHDSGQDIDAFCDERLAFLQGLGRLWRVFGLGWRRRVAGIRAEAKAMAGVNGDANADNTTDLHAGMYGPKVKALQVSLRKLGYPCGQCDGQFGEQLRRAVILFQGDNELDGEQGVWQAAYDTTLADAAPMLPKRASVTHKDMETQGDTPIVHMNFLQRIFAWIFGGSVAAQTFNGNSLLDSVSGLRSAVEPLQGVAEWVSGNKLYLAAGGCVAAIALIRFIRSEHVKAFQNFSYQGEDK